MKEKNLKTFDFSEGITAMTRAVVSGMLEEAEEAWHMLKSVAVVALVKNPGTGGAVRSVIMRAGCDCEGCSDLMAEKLQATADTSPQAEQAGVH